MFACIGHYPDLDSVLKQCSGQIRDFLLIKVHPVLHHASLHHLPQVALVDKTVVWGNDLLLIEFGHRKPRAI